MTNEYLQLLIDGGYADEAGITADVVIGGENQTLCVNGEVVALVKGNPPEKVFSDSIDRISNITVKSGLFKKTLKFSRGGTDYGFTVKGGKNLLDYFKLLSDE